MKRLLEKYTQRDGKNFKLINDKAERVKLCETYIFETVQSQLFRQF